MALHNPQYIFGDFSPDEFNQFFVTPRSSVELPPYSGTALCGTQAADDLPDGQEYQRIEFGVNEVIEPSDPLPRTPSYSISSTLNPQAPEFILGCTTSKKTPDGIDKDASYSSIDCQYPGSALVLESSSTVETEVLEGDVSGGLGQRERKKKKKRPPGYYSYLKDGGDESISPEALVNGHTNSAVSDSVGMEDADFMGDVLLSVTPRTCNSPQNSIDFISDTVPGSPFPGALDDGDARTAGPPEGCHGADHAQPCLPADSPLRTAVAQPYTGPCTTEDLPVANGQILESSGQGTAANGVELHAVESIDSDPAKRGSTSPPAESAVSASGAIPISQPAKSWASLFHDSKPSSSSPVACVGTKCSPPAPSPLVSEKHIEVKEGLVPVSEDPVAIKIAELLENVTLVHKPVSLQPRGLINKGNWCYINATLQALVACPPMYHLMKFIPLYSKVQRPCTSTPMIDSFVRLMNEFTNMPVPPKPRQALGDKIVRDIRPGAAFEPTYIYRLLTVIKSSLSEKGRQEDAEEYLGFILNGLHEEMLSLKTLLSPHSQKVRISNGPRSQLVNEEEQEDQGAGSEDEWEQVGPRNKTSVTRQADFIQTPITGIFGGHIRSVVYQQSSKESATLQPFFTLQLDIQSDKIRTVQDALESLVARESVQGYTTKTKQEVEISRRVTLEKLPPVLVLHLKRFVYEKTGGCQKLIKNIDYPVDLEISKELLSPGVKNKNFKCHRTYRLFAVVYHHGNSATGGHYTTDVFQIGLNGWLRIDDQMVKVINQYQVVKPTAERTAYLLYYRRVDLL
ncbi:ubiquitin carboxyl-terminal hydrolase 10 [Dipodomys spectabilis]|uniref:ubiquitin carboxyl-terminal hydrolase 10 n=1 Tax=Dipodomys spectabilis TaxID=105255 RepID=UPI001C537989|nr:ubiquitin carboxyl-terminal hydrolase 10 [Dipodomys spectabilis]XP_042527376.1 ubiquitin carboxyl-terminal hydrolase 10 [Dipodomys spectabilis]XP_042527377.1 ubiquitin carboxyl-terminal hydrolase 10 [Dipodomys spectabilis]